MNLHQFETLLKFERYSTSLWGMLWAQRDWIDCRKPRRSRFRTLGYEWNITNGDTNFILEKIEKSQSFKIWSQIFFFYFRCSSGDLYSRFETFASLRQCGIRNFNEDESDELIRIRFDLISTWPLKYQTMSKRPKSSRVAKCQFWRKYAHRVYESFSNDCMPI